MSKIKKDSKKRSKKAARGLVLCFVATVVLTGAYTWTNYKSKVQQDLEANVAKKEIVEEEPTEEASGKAYKAEEPINPEELPDKEEKQGEFGEELQQTNVDKIQANFTEGDLLLWPVDGNVIMSYSMDKTVYFETLDQYKYNPALIIAGAENDNVMAAAPGIIKSIDRYPQIGNTVTVDMGNGYECIYGQLKDVQVRTGEYVSAGTILGYLDEPTKYYSLEGCNLYFEMRKDAQPVNPIDYVAGE